MTGDHPYRDAAKLARNTDPTEPTTTRCAATLAALGAAACCKGPADSGPNKGDDAAVVHVYGTVADEGFGAAVAMDGDELWVGAPHDGGGRVFQVVDGEAVEQARGEGRLGSTLVAHDGGWLAGDPLAKDGSGRLAGSEGAEVTGGDGSLGLALACDGDWVAAHAGGWISGAGDSGTVDGRPTSVALHDGQVAVGLALGATALVVGDAKLVRPVERDEAGFALAAGDVDGDGQVEWLLGAPGADCVYVVSADGRTLEGKVEGGGGRFGAALAVADVDGDGIDDLVVGAPGAGAGVQGAASLFLGPDLGLTEAWQGSAEGDQLGTSAAARPGRIVLGAPGGPGRAGQVWVVDR